MQSSDNLYVVQWWSSAIKMPLKKGDRVVTTGHGKTKKWGNVVGIVTHRRGENVFVVWEGTSFPIEDEMDIKEVKPHPMP